MKISVLSSLSYGKGNVVLFNTRLNNIHTDNVELFPEFTRSLLEMASSKDANEMIKICYVSLGKVDSVMSVSDKVNRTNFVAKPQSFLSDSSPLEDFNCLIISGLRNNLSPLVISSIWSYVANGGGLIVLDPFVEMSNLSLFDDVAPVYVLDHDFVESEGGLVWTEGSVFLNIYSSSFTNMKIKVLSTIRIEDLDSKWKIQIEYDTELLNQVVDQEDIDNTIFFKSIDYDIPSSTFVGYFGSSYKDGLIDLKN